MDQVHRKAVAKVVARIKRSKSKRDENIKEKMTIWKLDDEALSNHIASKHTFKSLITGTGAVSKKLVRQALLGLDPIPKVTHGVNTTGANSSDEPRRLSLATTDIISGLKCGNFNTGDPNHKIDQAYIILNNHPWAREKNPFGLIVTMWQMGYKFEDYLKEEISLNDLCCVIVDWANHEDCIQAAEAEDRKQWIGRDITRNALWGNTQSEETKAKMTGGRANSRQVGGDHYKHDGKRIEHWDLSIQYMFDPFQYQITKYVMRWKDKNGVEDLKKAAHFLEKYIEEHEAYLNDN